MFSFRFLLLLAFQVSVLQAEVARPPKFTQVYESVEKAGEKGQAKAPSSLIGQPVPLDSPVLIGQHSRVEFEGADYVTRIGGPAEFECTPAGGIALRKGVILVQPVSKTFKLDFRTEKSAFTVEGGGCFQIETTTNGGCKVMLFTDRSKVRTSNGEEQWMTPGNLLFLVPGKNGFGPTLDIDLGLLCATSRLVNGFQRPLSRVKDFRAAAFFQKYRIKGKSNALVGDASNERDYEVIFVK